MEKKNGFTNKDYLVFWFHLAAAKNFYPYI